MVGLFARLSQVFDGGLWDVATADEKDKARVI